MTAAERKELKEILKLITENIVGAWDGNLDDTVDAVVLDDHDNNMDGEPHEEEKITKYNGWHDRLVKLSKG